MNHIRSLDALRVEGERAVAAVERIAAHLDRHDADWNWCSEAQLSAMADLLEAFARDVDALMPEPRVIRHGVLMPCMYADAIDRHANGGRAEAARVAALLAVPR
jgi:hypothetical protein